MWRDWTGHTKGHRAVSEINSVRQKRSHFQFSSHPAMSIWNGICIYRGRRYCVCINSIIICRYGWLQSWINWIVTIADERAPLLSTECEDRICTHGHHVLKSRHAEVWVKKKKWCRVTVVVAGFWTKNLHIKLAECEVDGGVDGDDIDKKK